ncbi:hypothetical protein VP14_011 [Vibrio phage VPMCC14]|nr:hypothetical protein VP14_011 [Vibrio phage VPMCC14]
MSDSYHIDKFIDAGFTRDYVFWRSDKIDSEGRRRYWYYSCPVCSEDEYVRAGLCTGIFEGHEGGLVKGFKACRCGKLRGLTSDQAEFRVKKLCDDNNITYIGWEDSYLGVDSKFKWLCKDGHLNSTSVSNFVSGVRCKRCRDKNGGINGYYPHRKYEKDYLYIMDFNDKYIKVGRSFDVDKRFKGDKGLLKSSKLMRDEIKVLTILTGIHDDVYDTEQWLHEELRERGFEYNEDDGLWSTELFDLDCIDSLHFLLRQTDLERLV